MPWHDSCSYHLAQCEIKNNLCHVKNNDHDFSMPVITQCNLINSDRMQLTIEVANE